ncbi:valine--tRNA ligase [Marine Group I thaumarchaeote]|uniref:Valine--tRNA ligase n=1 Tax=Marine Group I thaumarchaeote TaxID=2511932 RepID=A0A7K4P4G5_9ARCH|nr:MAG: valine--tRNA ligase [Nitrosopumilus sp. YT1]NMI82200.1 valine--tRNA ligase [Candidatus Nitrosopumilus sp. MTA1]NWJ56231.1 valine--tRNA ligase [Marine Group I thaumarchaeote]NWJ84060.1 valine--tRNA ligase [Marine Group I thaumarchaeote]NWK00925.1 valine--tRNA ligase [Marine Group I thaumarchaeote]
MEPKISEKAWNPELEKKILKQWEEEKIYDFIPQEDNFTIDTPPPYPSGRPWHIGAAAHYSQIDMIARTARMAGKNVYFPIGIDRNGLPVELYTEKKYKIRMRETDREEFLNLCRNALDDLEAEMILIMKNMGISGDFANYYRTDSEEYRTLTQSTFIELWKKDQVYLANRPNNYDWVSGTTIADAEIIYEDLPTKLVYMKFKIKDTKQEIVIASTRPELVCACKTIIVNPKDERYTQYIGKKIIVPITNAEVELRTHHSAQQEFGSGAVMICSYGDQSDVALFRELGLEEVVAIGLDGKMTEAAGEYAGLKPKQARTKIIEDLESKGFVEKIEDIIHRTPISERSKIPIEIIPMEEYYLKQKESVEKMKKLGQEITFYPAMHKQILMNWLESINIDWPISRRRFYGTEIPIWYCKKCSEPHVPQPGKYYRPWKENCPISKCPKCQSTEFVGEERTFDTWMDSSISPLFVSKFKKDEEFFSKVYPASIRPQAKDIVRTWLYYTLLRCEQLTGKKPWSEAWIMGYGLDEKGMKMSKSKGNAIDPLPLIEKLGADTFRFWSASEINHGYDFRCNEQKIESNKKFLSKLWNVSRFLSSFPVIESGTLTASDKWVLSELDNLVKECKKGYDEYNFFIPAIAIREFTWNLFAAHYIEMVKARAYGIGFSDEERDGAIFTLHKTLSTILKLLAPIIPFITEHLWKILYSKESIHKQKQVKPENIEIQSNITKEITEFNSKVWNEKKSQSLSLKDSIKIEIPTILEPFKKDLKSMHNLVD